MSFNTEVLPFAGYVASEEEKEEMSKENTPSATPRMMSRQNSMGSESSTTSGNQELGAHHYHPLQVHSGVDSKRNDGMGGADVRSYINLYASDASTYASLNLR
jgi:hypothetical protein